MKTLNGSRKPEVADRNGDRLPVVTGGEPPRSGPVFDAASITLQRRMRFNPLRMLDPENLSIALDQFDIGILRQAALLWDAMIRRDDTLSFVVPQLENAIAAKPWGVFKKKGADEAEAARHAAALEYFYGNVTAVDAFDRNVRGGRHLLLKQMGAAFAMRYSAHHFVWRPEPGKMIEVEGAAPVPALTAELEHVPLWFFENVSGTLRFLPFGGFGLNGKELNWEGEWMVTTGAGIMFAASCCYVFKRLTFQDWTIFNERYAQPKVIGMTSAQKDSEPGRAMAEIITNFNGDQGIALFETQAGDKPPISLLGPEGAVTADIFERFLERQDRKMTVMFRGSDLRNMSREKETTGVSAQSDETEALEIAHCANIADACRTFIDRNVIRFCFGEGVEPLAYFGLPDMEKEDAQQLRENAAFLADRGLLVEADTVADRLGITLTDNEDDALQSAADPVLKRQEAYDQYKRSQAQSTGNSKLARLQELVEEALWTANADDPDIERWITVQGRHIPIRKGQSVEEAIHHHGEWHKTAKPGEKNRRQNQGMKWHLAQHKAAKKAAKEQQNPSQSGAKNETIHEHGHSETPTAGTHAGTGETGGSSPSHVERATRDELGRAARADTGEHDLQGSHARQVEALSALRAHDAAHRVEPDKDRKIGQGAEHLVEHHATDPRRVLKHTTEGFGVVLHAIDAPRGSFALLREATPLEYLARMDAMNHAFGTDFRLDGITKSGEHIGLAVSQTAIQGGEPSHAEMEKFMRSGGYRKVKADAIANKHMEDKTWFRPGTGIVVADVKPDNFKKDAKGRLVPIDLVVQHAPAGSGLHRAFANALEK